MFRASQPIRRTLMQMIFLSCGAVLLVTTVAYLGYELLTFRQSSVQQLQTLGEAIATNSTAALAFDNKEDAAVVLDAFKADSQIVAAALYDVRGEVFATYPRDLPPARTPVRVGPNGYEFTVSRLRGFQPVTAGSRQLGTLYVESSLAAVYQRLRLYGFIALLVTAVSSLVAYLIANRLQHRLLQPIHALTEAARAVSDRNDYTVRATPTGSYEFDLLTDTFNHMLQQIQRSEHRLQTQLGRLGLLQHITQAIGDRQDLQSIYQVALGNLEDNLHLDFCCVLNFEPAAETLSVSTIGARSRTRAVSLGLADGMTLPVDANGLSRCVTGQLVYEPDVADQPFAFPRRFASAGLHSLVIAPLTVEGEVSGVLVCARRAPQAFSSSDCEFLLQLSGHIALASHQIRLYGELQRAYDDLRQSQVAVLQQERLRALGQMASGIAHDINNAISPVALYTEILLEGDEDLSERARTFLTTIQSAISDVARTVARMREFYRERETLLAPERININRAVEQVVNLTRPRWRDQPLRRGTVIDLQTELAADLPDIMGAENEIRDALTNLIFNAVDAMPNGGSLTLRTFREARQNESLFVVIEVVDTGCGMDEDTRRRCLEPFYTTKGERGTGLGLAMVYGMIQRHNAELEIVSAIGKGTTMRLMFAALSGDPAQSARQLLPQIPGRPLRILLVDDDPMVLQSMQSTLQHDGHMIVAANGGQTGIDLFRSTVNSGERYDLVITDLGMPHVDGRKVAAAIKALSPATPVILLTGWGQRMIAESETPSHVDKVIGKPPRLRELRTAFAELAP